jgi:hypothetical protein
MSQDKNLDPADWQMNKREERMADGRLLIYYTFLSPSSQLELASAAQVSKSSPDQSKDQSPNQSLDPSQNQSLDQSLEKKQ